MSQHSTQESANAVSISRQPMVWILLFTIVGIILSKWIRIPDIYLIFSIVLCVIMAFLSHIRWISELYLAVALIFFGLLLTAWRPHTKPSNRIENSLHTLALHRMEELHLAKESTPIVFAMSIGERSKLSPAVRRPYSHTGTAHLLAVSGLHVGVIFLLVNLFLRVLVLLRYGHIAYNLLSILFVWLYAITAGLSPGTIRASIMFSALQLALATASQYQRANILCTAAFLMLLWSPDYLFQLSFQLSCLAVVAIFLWGIPLYRICRTHSNIANVIIGAYITTLVAALITLPISSHYFGIIPLLGSLINPISIMLAYVIVLMSIGWILFPIGYIAPLVRFTINTAWWLLDRMTNFVATLPGAAINYRMTATQMLLCYLGLSIFTLVLYRSKIKIR